MTSTNIPTKCHICATCQSFLMTATMWEGALNTESNEADDNNASDNTARLHKLSWLLTKSAKNITDSIPMLHENTKVPDYCSLILEPLLNEEISFLTFSDSLMTVSIWATSSHYTFFLQYMQNIPNFHDLLSCLIHVSTKTVFIIIKVHDSNWELHVYIPYSDLHIATANLLIRTNDWSVLEALIAID